MLATRSSQRNEKQSGETVRLEHYEWVGTARPQMLSRPPCSEVGTGLLHAFIGALTLGVNNKGTSSCWPQQI
jgi:hypothetical protein